MTGSPEPTKAWTVERITRGVTVAVVYAESAEDARRRFLAGECDPMTAFTEHEGRGFGRVRRAPEQDR